MPSKPLKARAVNTKRLSIAVADFVKLYNVDLATVNAIADKKAAEEKLIAVILEEVNKYEK